MKHDGEVSQRGKQEKQMQNGTVKLKKKRPFVRSLPPKLFMLFASLCTWATKTTSPCTEFLANLQSSGEVLGVLHSSLLGLQTSLWLDVRRHPLPQFSSAFASWRTQQKCSLFTPIC